MLIGGKYRLQKQLGEGAMGTVWSALNPATGGQVAIKLILRSEPELRHRLLREAQACGKIRHKNVVQVFDVGTTDKGDPFLVMELLQGETLAARLERKRRLPPQEAASIARDVARALAAAHREGIVHRDLKPANIFLHDVPGEEAPVVKVVDFGVSKDLLHSDGLRTVAGGAVGSPMYMSPEQARAERDLDDKADCWSLGVVLYEMLAGERPFSGETAEVIYKIVNEPAPRVARRVRKIDPDLDRIIAGCLTRDRTERLGPADEIARQLEPHSLPAMRAPLPSLMDTGAYDGSAPSSGSGGAALSSGSGGAALSPGSGGAALSPGLGRSGLRPSGSPGMGPTSLQRSSSPGSGPTSLAADSDDDAATRPLDAGLLQSRFAAAARGPSSGERAARSDASPASAGPSPAPPTDSDWGPTSGGTIPINAYSKALPTPAARAAPVPPAPPAPPAKPAPRDMLGPRDTVRMEPGVGEALRAMGATQAVAPTAAWEPIRAPAPAAPTRKQPRGDRAAIAAVVVIVVSSLAAIAIWRLFLARPSAPGVVAPPPSVVHTADSSVPAPVAPPSTSTAASPSSTSAAPGTSSAPAPTAAPSATPSSSASAPATKVTPPSTSGTKTSTATSTKPPCKSKFGINCDPVPAPKPTKKPGTVTFPDGL